eukprot:1159401-Pelagomonas_calceolata.AAC.3
MSGLRLTSPRGGGPVRQERQHGFLDESASPVEEIACPGDAKLSVRVAPVSQEQAHPFKEVASSTAVEGPLRGLNTGLERCDPLSPARERGKWPPLPATVPIMPAYYPGVQRMHGKLDLLACGGAQACACASALPQCAWLLLHTAAQALPGTSFSLPFASPPAASQ